MSEPHEVGLWKHIKRGWDSFSKYTRFEVGDRYKIKFWHDIRFGDIALKEVYPEIHGIAQIQEASIANLVEIYSCTPLKNATFIRATWLGNWCIHKVLQSCILCVGGDANKIFWSPSKIGKFCSFYKSLIVQSVNPFPWKKLGRPSLPLK